MDERSQNLIARGMAITLGLFYLALFVSAIWKYVSTKDITNSTVEIILIVLIPLSIIWFARKDESLTLPERFQERWFQQNKTPCLKRRESDITFGIH